MTYSETKPDAGPAPSIDVTQIQTNFAEFAAVFATNHVALNQAFQGKHSTVIIQNRVGISDPGVTKGLTALYVKEATQATAGPQPQLFVQIPKFLPTILDTTNAPNKGMQLTYNTVNVAGPIYQSFLVGGYLVYLGELTGMTVPNATLALTVTLTPAPTKLLIAMATGNNTINGGNLLSASTIINSPTTFTVYSFANGSKPAITYTFRWMAIGIA